MTKTWDKFYKKRSKKTLFMVILKCLCWSDSTLKKPSIFFKTTWIRQVIFRLVLMSQVLRLLQLIRLILQKLCKTIDKLQVKLQMSGLHPTSGSSKPTETSLIINSYGISVLILMLHEGCLRKTRTWWFFQPFRTIKITEVTCITVNNLAQSFLKKI